MNLTGGRQPTVSAAPSSTAATADLPGGAATGRVDSRTARTPDGPLPLAKALQVSATSRASEARSCDLKSSQRTQASDRGRAGAAARRARPARRMWSAERPPTRSSSARAGPARPGHRVAGRLGPSRDAFGCLELHAVTSKRTRRAQISARPLPGIPSARRARSRSARIPRPAATRRRPSISTRRDPRRRISRMAVTRSGEAPACASASAAAACLAWRSLGARSSYNAARTIG